MIGHNGAPSFSSDSGWVAIARSMRGHPLVGFHLFAKPANSARGATQPALAFIDLIMECQYEDGTVVNGGRRMAIKRGQMVGAVSWLAHRWNWTPMAVRIWLDKLEADMMISREIPGSEGRHAGAVSTVISLSNYDQFQHDVGSNNKFRNELSNKSNNEKTTNISDGNRSEKSKSATNKQQTQQPIPQPIPQQQYKDNKEQKEQEDNPPTPLQGGVGDGFAKSEVEDAKARRRALNREAAQQAFVEWKLFARRIGLRVPRDSSFETFGQKMAARMYQHADAPKGIDEMLAVWRLAMSMVERSKLCRGMTPRKFYADLKFLCQPESFDRLITGGYGNGAAHSAPPSQVDPEHDERQRQEREAIEQRLAAEGWHIPNQGVTRE